MTTETTAKEEGEDALERPFSTTEIIRLYLFIILLYPITLGSVFLLGAYLHSYPQLPTPWTGFWIAIGGLTCIGLINMTLLLDCPRLVRQRMSKVMPGQDELKGERDFHKLVSPIFLGGLIGMGYDGSQRRGDTFPPASVSWMSLGVFAISMMWIVWVMRTNKYAARIVFHQADQKLITTGPYGVVRHPMYMGIIPLFLSMPLVVGSIWPLVPMMACVFLMAIRTYSEEEFLLQTFGKDYQQYQTQVPYRMAPWIF